MIKVLPQDTVITHYFEYRLSAYSLMKLPDGRYLLRIAHVWNDGSEMRFAFQYADDVIRTGINPLHIVKLYNNKPSPKVMISDIDKFLLTYRGGNERVERA